MMSSKLLANVETYYCAMGIDFSERKIITNGVKNFKILEIIFETPKKFMERISFQDLSVKCLQ